MAGMGRDAEYRDTIKRKIHQSKRVELARDDGLWGLYQEGRKYYVSAFDPSGTSINNAEFLSLAEAIIYLSRLFRVQGWYK